MFLNHLDIFFRADCRAITAALAKLVVADKSILVFAGYAGLRANQYAHLAGNTILLQEFWLGINPPGTGFICSCSYGLRN